MFVKTIVFFLLIGFKHFSVFLKIAILNSVLVKSLEIFFVNSIGNNNIVQNKIHHFHKTTMSLRIMYHLIH